VPRWRRISRKADSRRSAAVELGHDLLKNAASISEHIIVPEADHAETKAFDVTRPLLITSTISIVLATVNLDDELRLLAKEVGEVVPHGDFPPKFPPLQSAGAQMRPQLLSGIGLLASQLPRP
jgi:hypothetical protein